MLTTICECRLTKEELRAADKRRKRKRRQRERKKDKKEKKIKRDEGAVEEAEPAAAKQGSESPIWIKWCSVSGDNKAFYKLQPSGPAARVLLTLKRPKLVGTTERKFQSIGDRGQESLGRASRMDSGATVLTAAETEAMVTDDRTHLDLAKIATATRRSDDETDCL